jgi:folate-binding protein YgfZ
MTTTSSSAPSLQGAVRLADWGLIRAQGDDAASFLHGQLTQDMTSLREGQARLAGYCSAKGRLLATFVAWRSDASTLLLACSADLLPQTLKRLSMFVLRAKCKLTDASADVALYGLAGDAAREWLGPGAPAQVWQAAAIGEATALRLPDAEGVPRYLLCMPAQSLAPQLPVLPGDTWAWLEARSAVPRIVAATVEQFVPQMVNLEALDGVNFRKGCYPGQEVVARSQYRGTLKRRGFLLSAQAPAAPGQEVFSSADPDQPAGMVVNAGSHEGLHAAFVELKISALEGSSLHLGSADGPQLHPAALPYELPTEA